MKNKRIKNTIILCVFSLIAVILGAILLVQVINTELTNQAKQSLNELANQQQSALNRQLENMIYNLKSTAETLPIIGDNPEEILEYINSKKRVLGFETAIIADGDGEAIISTTHEYVNIIRFNYFLISMNNRTFATETHKSRISDKDVVTVSAPIIVDGKVTGVLAFEYSTDFLSRLLATFTDESGQSFILNNNGKIMVCTNPSDTDADYFSNVYFEDDLTYEEFLKQIKGTQTGSISYSTETDENFGEFRPIVINDWTLFFQVSRDALNESSAMVEFFMIIMTVMVIGLGLTIILYITITKNRYAEKLEQIAYFDELTDSPNMRKLKMHMEYYLNEKPSDQYGVVKIDVTNFKVINEIYGYEIGNKVLRSIAGTGRTVQDKKFLQARTGIDEFIFFAEGELVHDLHNNKEDFQAHFRALVPELIDHDFFFRYGRYFIKKGETNINDIINKVNFAHTIAKNTASREVCDYDGKFTENVLRDAEINNKRYKSLLNNEFHMYLQPKVSLETGKVIGAEALVRWIEPNGKMIFPNEFIPLFERNAFILELDKYMMIYACKLIKHWEENNMEIIPISVNFSRLHLHNLHFVEELSQITEIYDIEPKYIDVELTETIVSDNESDLNKILKKLQKAGFLVSIDDFGSGYSSLGMLKNFSANTLKLDRSFFVEANDNKDKGNIIVESIVELAKNLGMHTVAEGIESEQEIEFLKKIGCNAVQGYFYSKPLPVQEFEKYRQSR